MANQNDNMSFIDTKYNFFKGDLKADKQKKVFETLYKKNNGDWVAIKSELTKDAEFTPSIIKNLEFTHYLANWSDDSEKLITEFKKDKAFNSMRDIALNTNKESFIKKVATLAPVDDKLEQQTYALNLHKKLFQLEPTAMLINMVKDPQVPMLNNAAGADVVKLLEKNPEFNIKATSVYEVLKDENKLKDIPEESQGSVKTQLKTLQRIIALSPLPDAVPVLYNANLHTALQISSMPPAQFKAVMVESGLDETTLAQIHYNAQRVSARNQHTMMALREASQPTGVAMIDRSMGFTEQPQPEAKSVGAQAVRSLTYARQLEQTITKNNLSWDLLFGDADFCECGECNSVYSATSYYVELLQYLRNNNLDSDPLSPIPIKTNPKDISNTPLEKLFARRPDLGCLELTCKNTNTILPYVDLVNEVMENYVAYKRLKPFNVEDETSSELLAEPQHTEYQAYCILKNAVYPFTLPYHQPIDATRIYLKNLASSRYELISTFRKDNTHADENLMHLKNDALDKAADAEFLEITKEEYVILTKECFESKALMEKIKNKTYSDQEYQDLIGVKPVCEYYGYEKDDLLLADDGLTLIKKEFIPRTGIDYFNLVDLLKTEYINPCMPKGKSKAIMESLHFSYRFLQNYAKANGLDKMAEVLVKAEKLVDLFPALKDAVELLTNKKSLACPKSNEDDIEISEKDLTNWVKCQFEKVGKIIVIETGRGCVNGKITLPEGVRLNDIRLELLVKDCKIFFERGDEQVELASIDKKTGKITPTDETTAIDADALKAMVFTGVKGEKGTFIVVENAVHLIFLEQKDSCDLDTAVLQHLDGTPVTLEEYDRIHRFIRLWRKLNWSIDEVDKAIVALSAVYEQTATESSHADVSICEDCGHECDDCGCDDCTEDHIKRQLYINTSLIHQLTSVKQLLDKTGLELIRLLSFWGAISTSGEKSLYQKLFLTHNVLAIDKVFKPDANGNYFTIETRLTDHLPAVMAALNLSSDDIVNIMKDSVMDDKLSLKNLSILYRYRLLAKFLGLKIPAFIEAKPLFAHVFASASATLAFLNIWEKMELAGFSYQQLNYVIRGKDNQKKPFNPSKKNVLLLSKSLYDGLNTIDTQHQDLTADEGIADVAQQKINVRDKATSDFVRTKASLLFEAELMGKIIGYLEGSNIFTTNAPKNVDVTIADTNSLKNKFKYDKVNGSIQVIGILTAQEKTDFIAITNDIQWGNALTRIEKQQKKLFKELFAGILDNEKTLSLAQKTQIGNIIKSGDVIIALDKVPDGQPDPNTAPQKRVEFLGVFLPYLRQQLSYQFIVETLTGFAGLENKVTEALVTEVLVLGTPAQPIYTIFENIKETSKPSEANWKGYLIPPSSNRYTFVVRNTDVQPVITIDGQVLNFTQQEDPTNEWWSLEIDLEAGKLYWLTATSLELKNIFWKTPVSSITVIPTSALIPDFASQQCEPALVALKKASLLVSAFNLSADEIRYLQQHATAFDDVDFNAITLQHWLRLDAYTRLRNSLPGTDTNILDFWAWSGDASSDAGKLTEKIAGLTGRTQSRLDTLIQADRFNIAKLTDYRNEINLLKLQNALAVADKIGLDINILFASAIPTSKFNECRKIADGIKNAMRAKYNQTDWELVVKPLNDDLRNHQSSALTAYLLQQKELIDWGVTDADGLFEFFLIDVQMCACMETSRIKQAISSVQLFIQRCFLGLEEEHNGIAPDILDRDRWNWMQRYRVWEANRKVFLYPENWIESNLRDDKSAFFKELESELLQKDINKQNVSDALKSYLYKVDDVANMETVGLFVEGVKAGINWSEKARLHVFARTRSAPNAFYYRYLALDEMNWYPWEKMQLDIPIYDVTNANNEITGNGCYLTPFVWNGRLLVFFPQVMKKTKPNSTATGQTVEQSAGSTPDALKPIEYYEIKMGWSEYRNGKWTQKQVTSEVIRHEGATDLPEIKNYAFVPVLANGQITIKVFYQGALYEVHSVTPGVVKSKLFVFDGNQLEMKEVQVNADGYSSLTFHYSNQAMRSLSTPYANTAPAVSRNNGFPEYADTNGVTYDFHITQTNPLLGLVNQQLLKETFAFNLTFNQELLGPFDHDNSASTPNVYHELKHPYSIYSWEFFFHTPLLLADALSKAQHFEEAMKWFHFVFNPFADGNDDQRFWQFKPFKEIDSKRVLDSIFNHLQPNKPDQTISEWRNKPFMPHVVARSRPVAYMKWVVMKYLDNLVAWGDYLFRQDTIESINQATQLYILAGHILGPKPMMIPKRGKIKPQTYIGLLDKWDAFGNAVVELEITMPFSNQTDLPIGVVNGEIAFANIYGLASSLYFCIPNNPKLLGYWDTLADRLYKIRHCENIQGIFRKLPLFEPPIDPALLVKAAAQGLSIDSVINDLNTPMPNYRFYYLLQKSLELCNELKSMGSAMLSAIEKKDNETIALIRSKHEGVMQNLIMEIKKKQLEEAEKNLNTLVQNRKAPAARMKYYLKLAGLPEESVPTDTAEFNGLPNEIVTVDGDSGLKLIPFEKEDMDKASDAQDKQLAAALPEKLASILHVIPNFSGNIMPFGIGMSITLGGSNLGAAAQAWAKFLQLDASELSYASSRAGKKGGFTRALQERVFQANTAGYELKQIDKQITAQQIRIDIANQEITNQQKQIDNSNEVEEFLKNKYSNEELYVWMRGSLKTLYHQIYNLAYDLAKKAERTYCFERGIKIANFIQSGYFDAGRDGLLAGEQLYVGLKQMESAYQSERGYNFEITKHISLYQLHPLAIIQLRQTGKCEFVLPEALFDLDFPGHFKRRIKSVTVSLPCIAGPYTSVSATLTLLENKYRNTAIGGKAYEENSEETDDRFSTNIVPINAIATSSAQNDGGAFELNFKDERYLPFEGAGVVSKWRLELPDIRQFDYATISDLIMHVKYTANEGGGRLKLEAGKSLTKQLKNIEQELNESGLHLALNLKHDLPNEWHLFKKLGTVNLKIEKSRLPYMVNTLGTIKIEDVLILAKLKDNGNAYSINIDETATSLTKINVLSLCKGNNSDIKLDTNFELSADMDKLENLDEMVFIIKYT
jgi:hypothetical protein